MLQSPLRSPLSAVVKDVIGHPGNRLPFNKFISALLSKSGRVAAYYGESWDEILAYNAVQVAAGTPSNCVAFEDSEGTIPLVAPLGAGKGCGLLLDRSLGLVRGPEAITNHDFSSGGTGWAFVGADASHIVTFSGGQMRYQSDTTSPVLTAIPTVSLVVGKWYEIIEDVAAKVGSGALKTDCFGDNFLMGESVGLKRRVAQCTSTTCIVYRSATNVDTTFNSISFRELPGNHRVQTSATARGEMSRRVNMLTATEFAGGVTDAPIRGGLVSATSMTGYAGAIAFGHDGVVNSYAYKSQTLAAGKVYVMSVDVSMDDGLPPVFSGEAAQGPDASFVLVAGGSFALPANITVTPLVGGLYRVKAVFAVSAGNAFAGVAKYQVQLRNFKVTAYDLRPIEDANIGKPYQRVTSASDYDEEGFPAFLRRQTDDWSKARINPNGATKVLVLTSVQKMSDATSAMVFEASVIYSTNNGTLALFGPHTNEVPSFLLATRGTTARNISIASGSPARSVLGMKIDIAGNTLGMGINGSVILESSANFGGGQFLEYDYFFGSRAGTSLFVNDREYGPPLILFMQPSDPGLTSAEISRLTRQFNKSIKAF